MQAFYQGGWRDCASGKVSVIRNPFTGDTIDMVPTCHEAAVDAAMQSLKSGARTLAGMGGDQLGDIFTKAAALLRAGQTELANLITQEQGKPIQEARDEVAVAVHMVETLGKDTYRLGRQFLPLAIEARVGERYGFTRRRAFGIAAVITPNTFPLLGPINAVIPALAAGNAVVLKPASQTPFSALRLVDCLVRSGLPAESMACLTGPGELTGQAICRHPLLDQVTLYGCVTTIRAIRSVINLIPLHFHHGGMSVCIVAADADLDAAVRSIVPQGFENSGQTATSAGAVFVEDAVHDEFVGRLAKAISMLPAGDPRNPFTRVGPLTESSRVERATRLIQQLIASGARLEAGTGMSEGPLLRPTLLSGVDPAQMSSCTVDGGRELLSPIMFVSRITGDWSQAAHWLDARTQIVASIFSRDIDRATQLAKELPVYNVHVNGLPTWRDGLIFSPQASRRLGRRKSDQRVHELTTLQDVVFHP